MLGNCLSADFNIKSNFLSKTSLSNIIRVPNSLDPDQARLLLGLIWVQTVCNGYQQTTLAGKELMPQFLNWMFSQNTVNIRPMKIHSHVV